MWREARKGNRTTYLPHLGCRVDIPLDAQQHRAVVSQIYTVFSPAAAPDVIARRRGPDDVDDAHSIISSVVSACACSRACVCVCVCVSRRRGRLRRIGVWVGACCHARFIREQVEGGNSMVVVVVVTGTTTQMLLVAA